MEPDEEVYCRKVYRKDNSLMVTIPIRLARKLGIAPGQTMRVAASAGGILYAPLDLGTGRPKPGKASGAGEDSGADPGSGGSGARYVDLDDPGFNPLDRLAL